MVEKGKTKNTMIFKVSSGLDMYHLWYIPASRTRLGRAELSEVVTTGKGYLMGFSLFTGGKIWDWRVLSLSQVFYWCRGISVLHTQSQ